MKIYTSKLFAPSAQTVVADDMILTKQMPTAAGSKMLDGYMSLFDAHILTLLAEAGFSLGGKADVGEFAIDLLGETSYNGAITKDGKLANASAEILVAAEALATVNLDVNGSVRRAAAQNGLVSIKPTYGTVSRYGTVPVACSGETVSVMATNARDCRHVLSAIVGHDDKDGTSLSEELCARVRESAPFDPVKKVALLTSMTQGIDREVSQKLETFCQKLEACDIEICEVESDVIAAARVAWNILMSAELCNNVSRYDGVKYGYRAQQFSGIDELYTNSRTEAFGELLKTAILFGSETLSTENYMKVYDKALRTRRVICEAFARLFESFDAVLMPACSTMAYTCEQATAAPFMPFTENLYTAPASITGLPALVTQGVQLVGKAFSENALFALAEAVEKEGK